MEPLLTVIIPVYNTEEYIARTIDSVLNQTLKSIQIVLVDDGSPDKAGDICDSYSSRFHNVEVIHKKNAGLGEARNSGIKCAMGKYLTFLDSDDFVDPYYYYNMIEACEQNNLDICVSKGFYKYVNDENITEFIYNQKFELIENGEVKKIIPRLICNKPGVNDCIWGSVCFSVYKTELFKANDLQCISERKFISEDVWFSMDIYNCAKRVMFSNIIGYYYRVNPTSLSRKYNPNRFAILKQTIKLFEEKCSNLGLDDWQERVQLFFWGIFEKCINQEIENKDRHTAIYNIKEMCSDEMVSQYVSCLAMNKNFKGSHAFLCRLVNIKRYVLLYQLVKLYNIFNKRNK